MDSLYDSMRDCRMAAMSQIDLVLDDLERRVGEDSESVAYLHAHRLRYRALLRCVGPAIAGIAQPRVLDVGPSYESELVRGSGPPQ
jgi:hypothetical protein